MTVRVVDFPSSMRMQADFDHVIGILDVHEHWRNEQLSKIKNRTMFWFDDVNNKFQGTPPAEEDIAAIIQLIRDKKMDDGVQTVLVHCAAGISRSTATAIGLLIMRGFSIEAAWNIMQRQRPQLWPNETVLAHF